MTDPANTTTSFTRLRNALAGRYVIQRELGRGGMSTVYLADDLKHQRTVAIKVLAPDVAASVGLERFTREIQIAARLSHPHILPLYDSGQADGLLYYVMPFVEGESLRQRLERDKRVPLAEALSIGREVASALAYAHDKGIVHRDIKPENILLSGGHAVVTDFGVARAAGPAAPTTASDETLTRPGFIVGTPAYMSPEQAGGRQELDGRSDIYSLGCTLYEMITGARPFTGPSPQAVLIAHIADGPPPLSKTGVSVPPAVEQLVRRALAKSPADRFATSGEFAAALASTTSAEVEAPTVLLDSAEVQRGRARRVRRLIMVAGAAAASLAAVAAGVRWWHPRLDANLVVVAPFEVIDPPLQLWREGLADVLTANLDGAGPLHAVPTSTAQRRFSGRPDKRGAEVLGRRTGAGLAVFGRAVATAPDSVRLTASILDVASGNLVGEFQTTGPASRMDRLADTLTVGLMRELGQTRSMGAFRLSSLGSRSLPALKAFVQGESYYRRAVWDSALASYQRALLLDSTFALALRRTATVMAWQEDEDAARDFALRAGALNHGLAIRDSLLVAIDSVRAAAMEPDTTPRELVTRLFGMLDDAARRYPTDPEMWDELGEARYHLGWALGIPLASALEAFDRTITLDSSFVPAYLHAVPLALRVRGASAARRYAAAYFTLHPREVFHDSEQLWLVQLALDPNRNAELSAAVSGVPLDAVVGAVHDLAPWPDSGEVAVRLAELARQRGDLDVDDDSADARDVFADALAMRGYIHEAYHLALDAGAPSPDVIAEVAMFGDESPDSLAQLFDRLSLDPDPHAALVAAPWWVARRDVRSLERLAARLSDARGRPPAEDEWDPAYDAESATAWLAAARGDTATALRAMLALRAPAGPTYAFDVLARARWLMDRGHLREAAALVANDPCPTDRAEPCMSPAEVPWRLTRGVLAGRLGQAAQSAEDLRFVSAMWRHADAVLQGALKARM